MRLILSSLNVVLPLFFMMLAGWLAKRAGLFPDSFSMDANRLLVRFFLPLMLFANTYEGSPPGADSRNILIFSAAANVCLCAACIVLVPVLCKKSARRSAVALGIFRPNAAIYGFPLATGLLKDAESVSDALMMTGVSILITNLSALFALEIFTESRVKPFSAARRALKNPILFGLLCGMIMRFLPFTVPAALASPVKSLAAVTTPLAFMLTGASFTLKSAKKNKAAITLITAVRLVLVPLLIILPGIRLFRFSGAALVSLISSFATPSAVSTVAMVRNKQGDAELMEGIVVFTTACSIPSIFALTYAFKSAGLL